MVSANFKSYAIAIFALAKDEKQKELFFDQIKQLDQINTTTPEFAKVLSSRIISKKERQTLAKELLSELNFDKTIIHWVWTIIDDNNYHNFHYIFKEVDKQHQQIFAITKIVITSAKDLDEGQKQKIKKFFESNLNAKVELLIKVKPEVIGGLKLEINNKTYNNTIKRKLAELKLQLLSKKGK